MRMYLFVLYMHVFIYIILFQARNQILTSNLIFEPKVYKSFLMSTLNFLFTDEFESKLMGKLTTRKTNYYLLKIIILFYFIRTPGQNQKMQK